MADAETPAAPADERNGASLRRVVLVGVPVLLVLLAAYWFGLRTRYEPILTSVAPDEAAEIVKVLEAKKVDYRLADDGRSILVASGEADQARLELVGSELPIRGQVGFELFNQSDMGLTEFAQKINYQRALQGELARTILLLQGIRSVRVHLGLPERSVFRGEQARPKASVTLILQPGNSLTESRVSGIQRMVAGAIPEMSPDAVAVLDGTGKVVSRPLGDASAAFGNSDAILESYQQRIIAAVKAAQPSLAFGVNVSLRVRPEASRSHPGAADASPAPRGDPDYAVNVRVTTPMPLDDPQRLELIRAIHASAGLDRARGDAIVFLIGEPAPIEPASFPPNHSDRVVTATAAEPRNRSGGAWAGAGAGAGAGASAWTISLGLAVLVLAVAAALWKNRGRRGDEREALTSFADQLRRRLAAPERAMP